MAAGRLTLKDGIVEVKGRIKGLDAEEAKDLIDDAVRYADMLETPTKAEMQARLVATAKSNDAFGVHRNAVAALLAEWPDSAAAAEACDVALTVGSGMVSRELLSYALEQDRIGETELIRWLVTAPDDVTDAIVGALGKRGSLSAVEPLLDVGTMEAKASIKLIQERAGGHRGGLAVVAEGDEAGRLSVAHRAAGALSITKK